MRKTIALVATAALLVLAACSSSTPPQTDPYLVFNQATQATYGDLVQLNLGVDGTSGGQQVHLDPSAIQIVLDTKQGRADVALALPVASLQLDAATMAALGVTGSTLDIEVLYDGTGLYAKGSVLQSLLTLLMSQSGGTPGDYSGWVELATASELGGLAASLVPNASSLPIGSGSAFASHDATTLKSDMTASGITLTYVGSEQKDGQQTDHLSATVDGSKLANSPMASSIPSSQLSQVESSLTQADVTADLWFSSDTHQLVELDATVTPKSGTASPAATGSSAGTGTVSLTLKVSTPANDSALQTPSNATQVNLVPMIQSLMQGLGQGLFTNP